MSYLSFVAVVAVVLAVLQEETVQINRESWKVRKKEKNKKVLSSGIDRNKKKNEINRFCVCV